MTSTSNKLHLNSEGIGYIPIKLSFTGSNRLNTLLPHFFFPFSSFHLAKLGSRTKSIHIRLCFDEPFFNLNCYFKKRRCPALFIDQTKGCLWWLYFFLKVALMHCTLSNVFFFFKKSPKKQMLGSEVTAQRKKSYYTPQQLRVWIYKVLVRKKRKKKNYSYLSWKAVKPNRLKWSQQGCEL